MAPFGRSRGNSGEWEEPFWRQRGWIVSAGFLLALLGVAGVSVIAGGDDGGSGEGGAPSPSESASGRPGAGEGRSDARPAGCRTDDGDQSTPTKAPKDLRWKVVDSVGVPVSKSAGPLRFDGPVWSCFARTPAGAVMAVHAISSQMGGEGWKEVADRQLAEGGGREAFVERRSNVRSESSSAAPGSRGTYAGFSVLSYSEEQATVMVLVRLPTGKHGGLSMSVVWEDGDWKLRPQSNGSLTSSISEVSGTQGFVTWGEQDG